MKIPHEPVAVQEEFAYITTEPMLGKELAYDDTKSEDLPKHPYEEPRAPAIVQFPLGIAAPSLYGFCRTKEDFSCQKAKN